MVVEVRQEQHLENCISGRASECDVGADTIESLIASPYAKSLEQICIERETAAKLCEAMDALPDWENVYVQYRYDLTDGEAHPPTENAQYF